MNTIKITSGKLRGRNISSPNLKTTHPMGAREKLALFNMITDYLPGAVALDAYAGSGALGIEALSRGANHVTFVEENPRAAAVIRENLAELGLLECAVISKRDVKDFLPTEKFDIIIADPPYDDFNLDSIENLAKFLKEDGVFVLSHPGDTPEIGGLKLQKTREYAGAHISIYTKVG